MHITSSTQSEGKAVAVSPSFDDQAIGHQAISDQAIGNIQAAIETLNHARGAGPLAALGRAFASIAGRATKRGQSGFETPVAGTQGRTQAGGMGLLSLTALTFATMSDAHAADANVTVLDEDNISFKQMPHGTLELVTKEAVPRYLVVEDPGETVVISKSGSSINVTQLANSPARMEELQAAQRELYDNWTKGLGPGGSGTTPFSDTLPVQPINFIQPDGPGALNSLPVLPAVEIKAEFIFIRPLPPEPTLTLALGRGVNEVDTVIFDTFSATSGTFGASSSSGGALTYGLSGGTHGNTVLNGVAYDVSQVGSYGTLYLNSASGAYTFVPNDASINALKAPTTQSFDVTVSDGKISASETFTIDIAGTNDEAIIAGSATGSVSDAPDVASAAGFAARASFAADDHAHALPTRVATGTLTSTDVDDPANSFTVVSSPTASEGGYGTFTMSADGVWTYTLDEDNAAVKALNVGDKLTDTFIVTTVDGTPQEVTIVIGGRNDPADISGDTCGHVVEAACKDPGIPTATGTLTATDVDNPDGFTPVKCGKSDCGFGTFTMSADGVWTYTLDNDNCKVQSLGDCDTLTDTFTVTSVDGTEQVITITIQGADDDRWHHHDYDHHDHDKWTQASASDVEAASVSGTASGQGSAGTVATQADTKNQSSAAPASTAAAAPDAGDSFHFKDQGTKSQESTTVGSSCCVHIETQSSTVQHAGSAPDVEFSHVQQVSDCCTTVPDEKQASCHFVHDLVV
jgi:VCBS repeat-containing protein